MCTIYSYISPHCFRNNMLPIVRGATRAHYEKVAPPNSFIHTDDFSSPKVLAAYLHRLDTDDKLYTSYFRWQNSWKIVDVWERTLCRVCAMLHGADSEQANVTWYTDIDSWVHTPGECLRDYHISHQYRRQMNVLKVSLTILFLLAVIIYLLTRKFQMKIIVK